MRPSAASPGLRSLAALCLVVPVWGCSGKRAAPNQTSNAIVATPAAPSPVPIPYPNASAAPRDVATGQATGKRQHGSISVAK